jgi:hypothetical protein
MAKAKKINLTTDVILCLILLIQTFSDILRQSKYGNPIARIGGIPQSYYRETIALFDVLRTPANSEDYAYK